MCSHVVHYNRWHYHTCVSFLWRKRHEAYYVNLPSLWVLLLGMMVFIHCWYNLTPSHWPHVLEMVCIVFCNTEPTLICSVGKAPIPTRVVYAFTTPYTSPTCWGGMPSPVHTPPTVQFDEVTKGYVPVRETTAWPCFSSDKEQRLTFLYELKGDFELCVDFKVKQQPKNIANSSNYTSPFCFSEN